MTEPVVVGTQTKFVKETNTIPKTLSCYQNGGANSYIACKWEGADYLIPAGKHFVILKVYMYTHESPTQTVSIFEHTAASTAGGQNKLDLPYVTITGDADFYFDLDTYVDCSSSNYINIFHQGTGSPVSINILGVECDN